MCSFIFLRNRALLFGVYSRRRVGYSLLVECAGMMSVIKRWGAGSGSALV